MEKTFKTSVKILSVFLVVLMVVMCYPFTAIAAIREAVSTLQESEVPEIVGYEEAVNSGYVNRLFEEESDLYSLLFGNLDGSKTKIVYDFPVTRLSRTRASCLPEIPKYPMRRATTARRSR